MASIRIIATPAGEAPLHVREAWVGLVLPLAADRGGPRRVVRAFGVLSGPRTFLGTLWSRLRGHSLRYDGYAVPILAALEVLGQTNPAAEQWWRDNTAHLIKPNGRLVFEAEACEEVA